MRNAVLRGFVKAGFTPQVIFDVGANIGQSVVEFRRCFPEATIVAFEPISASFEQLHAACGSDGKAVLNRAALGRAEGEIEMISFGTSTGNRVAGPGDHKAPKEIVPIWTGDSYCGRGGVEQIDFLKIDAEGRDLDVLVGFRDRLTDGSIRYVQVECGFSPENKYHLSYEQISQFLFGFDYRLHGVFDLVTKMRKIGTRRGALYGNAVFVKEEA